MLHGQIRAPRPTQLETETPDRRARGVRGPLLAHSLDCHLAVAPCRCVKSQVRTRPSVFLLFSCKLVIFSIPYGYAHWSLLCAQTLSSLSETERRRAPRGADAGSRKPERRASACVSTTTYYPLRLGLAVLVCVPVARLLTVINP